MNYNLPMTFFHAFILGIVEGITEFLPISSTAHLIITSHLLKLPQTEFQKFFEVFIQSGAILAVFLLYTQYVFKNKKIIKPLIFSFIPTAIVGFVLYKIIKNVFFESNTLIFLALVLVGLLFIVVEKLIKKEKIKLDKTINHLTINYALLIGLAQSLAVIPGVSRAGIVIIAMMLMGYKREEAAKYSFLLAVPTILAASGFDLLKTNFSLLTNTNNLLLLVIGFITSFITAIFAIRWFVSYLQKKSLIPFAIYRILVSLLLFF